MRVTMTVVMAVVRMRMVTMRAVNAYIVLTIY